MLVIHCLLSGDDVIIPITYTNRTIGGIAGPAGRLRHLGFSTSDRGQLTATHAEPKLFQRRQQLKPKGGNRGMPLVHVKEDETFENALRRFKRKCEKSGILSELKKRQHYEKPSTKRKRKAIAARKKVLRKLAEERRTGY